MMEEKNLVITFIISTTFLLASMPIFARSDAKKIIDDKESTGRSQPDRIYKFRVEPNKDGLNSPGNRDMNTDGPAGNPAEANLKKPAGTHMNRSPANNP